jgi:hypothetical protein
VLAAGLNQPSLFVPRLSPQAGAELQQLEDIVGQVVLNETRDARRGPFCIAQGKLDSGSLYRLLQSKDASPHPAAKFIWESRAPPLVQFFVWLLVYGRVQCTTNLLRKRIVDSPTCEVCNLMDETGDHIAFRCPFAEVFWEKLGIQPPAVATNDYIFDIACPAHFPKKHFSTFAGICYWHLWKRRNAAIFRQESLTYRQVFLLMHNDAKLWRLRLPKKDREVADVWCQFCCLYVISKQFCK